jgi:asparagine synthase (glutamine-hydrolysing)
MRLTYFSFGEKSIVLEEVSKYLYEMLKESCTSCKSNLISLSGGLDSTIISYFLKERKPLGIAIIAQDFVSTDLTYCQMASNRFDIPLTIHNVSTPEILSAIEETIKILENFNDIEIRNNVVMYLAIKWAKDHGYSGIITGDGADELFAGYSFLVNKPQEQLDKEIQRVCNIMHFPTQKIGNSLDIEIESPFLDKKIIEFSKNIPSELKVRNEGNKRYGKWILRKTFEKEIPQKIAWREKSPMQEGSGTSGLTDLFESIVTNERFEQKKKDIENSDGVIIRTKESMHYYEIFRKMYGKPSTNSESVCPYCKHDIGNSKFCRMCGAFPI